MSWLRNRNVLIGILGLSLVFSLVGWGAYEFLMPVEEKVDWVFDYDQAFNASKAGNKTLLIYFYTSWCSWCKTLSRNTYSNDKVADLLNSNFTCLKINAEEHPDFVPRYNISGYPTILFLSPEQKELGRILGYKPPDSFIGIARQYVLKR